MRGAAAAYWNRVIRLRMWLDSRRTGEVVVGDTIPDFTLRDLSGREVTLSRHFPEKSVLLWFTNLCSTCRGRIGLLNRLRGETAERLEILAVSTLGGDRRVPEEVARDHRPVFPILLDPFDWLGRELGFAHPDGACPLYNLLLLDRDGRVRLRHHLSAVGDAELRASLRSVGAFEDPGT